MLPTLLLNATYEPLRVIDWRKTMTLVFLAKVEALVHYEDHVVRSATLAIPLPAVVRLRLRVPWRRHRVAFSRRNVFLRDAFACQYCGATPPASELTQDHVIPRSAGGNTSWHNIVTACRACNQDKGNRTPEAAGLVLRKRPSAPKWLPLARRGERGARELPKAWEPFLW